MQKIVHTIKTLGFPVAVSAVLLYFCFFTLERNTAALVSLDKSVNILIEIVKHNSGDTLKQAKGSF
jgi:hypothetical protein